MLKQISRPQSGTRRVDRRAERRDTRCAFNMNTSHYHSLPMSAVLPLPLPLAIQQLGDEFIRAAAFLLIPTELLYFSIYFQTKGYYRAYKILTLLSIATFWISPYVAPITCGPARCLQNFASRFIDRSIVADVLTVCSCDWHNEVARYICEATCTPNLYGGRTTCGLEGGVDDDDRVAIRIVHSKPNPGS